MFSKKILFPVLQILIFFFGINGAISQINLRTVENFTLYTSTGAVSNVGISNITGDIGTSVGAITGFGAPSVVNGSSQNGNIITLQASLDLIDTCVQINNTLTTAGHAAVFGNGETLTPGVYAVGAAASLLGTLILDAKGDSNAEFIFKIGGQFSTGASSEVILINCASPAKIFWLATGAISMAASTNISGNLISNPGAVGMGAGGNVEGRMLSTTGAISVYGTDAINVFPIIGAVTQPTCIIKTGSFQIVDYDANNTYDFTPSVISISGTGLVTANPNTYILTDPNGGACIASVELNPAINYWTGAISSDWNNAENWNCSVPSDLNDLINIIPEVTTSYPIIGAEPDNSGLAKNLDIQSGASLTINSNYLRLTTILTLNGKMYLEEEAQLLQDAGSVFDASSTGEIEIDQQGVGNSFRYNYWSSPVNSRGTGFTIGEVLRDATDPNNIKNIDFGASYTFADGAVSSPIKLSTYWMYKLEDSGLGYSAWYNVGDTEELKVGQGYSMKGSNNSLIEQNYRFVGKPNNGVIELGLGGHNVHLVGNPYPSALDANKFIDDNGLSPGTASIGGAIYFWEHYGGDSHYSVDYHGGYATYSKAGGVSASSNPFVGGVFGGVSALETSVKGAPKRYIPLGQSFFVIADADGGQIQFNNSQRIFVKESSISSIFIKSNNSKTETNNSPEEDLRPKFRIGFNAPKISHRQILLTIDENTTDASDWGYDAGIYEVFEDDMYWLIDDRKYVIQATNELSLDKEIQLGIQTKEGGLISIDVDELENVAENMSVYIKDNLTGKRHDITNQPFEVNLEPGEYKNRFVLAFQPDIETMEAETLSDGVHIYIDNSISKLQLNRIVNTEILNVSLFDYLGKELKTWNINTDERFISLPVAMAFGVYIVKVETTTGIIRKKIIIN